MTAASTIDETYWTATEWAAETRIPYRTILRAVSLGELGAVRPSGTDHGAIHISESSWAEWIRRTRTSVRPAAPPRRPSRPRIEPRSLKDLELR